jgi:transposase, IS6 family
MAERGLSVDHVTIWRWVQRYAPVLNQRIRREIRRPNRSWRVDETYVKVAGTWAYLYRAVDSAGETIEFMLSPKRDLIAAKLFLRLALSGGGPLPRVINVDGHPAYASAVKELKQTGDLGRRCRCRTVPYLNNVIEQTIGLSRSESLRAWDSGRWTVPAERSPVMKRCTQSKKVRSAGSPRVTR